MRDFSAAFDNTPYPLNPQYIMHKSLISPIYYSGIYTILKQKSTIHDAMSEHKVFSTYAKHTDHYDVVTLIPIKNDIAQEVVGYAVLFSKSAFLINLFQNFYIQLSGAFLFAALLAFIYYKESKSKTQLRQSMQKIKDISDKNRTILDSSSNMIALVFNDEIIDVNESFLTFFGAKTIEELHFIQTDLANAFIKHSDYFYRKQSDTCWITELQKRSPAMRIVSMIGIDGKPKAFRIDITQIKHKHNEWVVIFSDITELQVKNRLLNKLAHYDKLTGIYNRRYFEEVLENTHHRLAFDTSHYALIMFDIDHFKRINDRFGHDVGDKALQLLAGTVSSHIRKEDIFARWGGEEFMLLVNTKLENACKVAEHLRQFIESDSAADANIPTFTCSFGVVAFDNRSTLDALYKRVDNKLYEAKEKGRNTVVV